MSIAFGITSEDVIVVSQSRMGLMLTEAQAEELFDSLDYTAIERAALHGDDLDEQTTFAYDEIQAQLGKLPAPLLVGPPAEILHWH